MTEIERRIFAAIRDATAEGLEPKSLYLTAQDRAQLSHRWKSKPIVAAGLPVRPVDGQGSSRLYCRHGIARAIRKQPSRRPAPRLIHSVTDE